MCYSSVTVSEEEEIKTVVGRVPTNQIWVEVIGLELIPGSMDEEVGEVSPREEKAINCLLTSTTVATGTQSCWEPLRNHK